MAQTPIAGMAGANLKMITAAFKQQFHDSFEIALQQKQSVLESLVYSRGQIQGASFTINDMDKVEMTSRGFNDRFSDTPLTVPKAGTRLAIMEDYDLFIPIEPFDLPKLSAAPDSPYMQLMVAAANRAKDKLIYRQLFADIQRREETEIQPGVTTAGIGAYKTVSMGNYVFAGGATGATGTTAPSVGTGTAKEIGKGTLIKIRAEMMRKYADEEEIYITYNDAMLQQILADTTLTSADYMAVQMLQAGDLSSKWLGLNWVKYQAMDACKTDGTAGTGAYKAAVFTKTALHFGTGINYSTDVQTRADLRNIKQLSAQMSFGAGRANEDKVMGLIFAG